MPKWCLRLPINKIKFLCKGSKSWESFTLVKMINFQWNIWGKNLSGVLILQYLKPVFRQYNSLNLFGQLLTFQLTYPIHWTVHKNEKTLIFNVISETLSQFFYQHAIKTYSIFIKNEFLKACSKDAMGCNFLQLLSPLSITALSQTPLRASSLSLIAFVD